MRHRAAQALAALGAGHATLASARRTVGGARAPLAEAVRTLRVGAPPSGPSGLAPTLTAMMQPPVPSGVVLDVTLAAGPPRLVLSAYLLKTGSLTDVADSRHASVEPDELAERLAALAEALHATQGLLAKLEAVG